MDPVGREPLNGARWPSDCGWEAHAAQCGGQQPLGRPAHARPRAGWLLRAACLPLALLAPSDSRDSAFSWMLQRPPLAGSGSSRRRATESSENPRGLISLLLTPEGSVEAQVLRVAIPRNCPLTSLSWCAGEGQLLPLGGRPHFPPSISHILSPFKALSGRKAHVPNCGTALPLSLRR